MSRTAFVAASLVIVLLIVLVASGAAVRGAPEAEIPWKALRAMPGPLEALVDCRSLTVPHEQRLPFGRPLALGGLVFRFEENASGRIVVHHRQPGVEESERKKVLSKLPALFPFNTGDVRMGLSVRRQGDEEAVRVASAYGLPIKVGKATAYLVDSDRNGVLGRPTDGYVAPDSRTVAPFTGQVWTERNAVEVRRAPGGQWQIRPLPMPYPKDKDHSAAWRLVQWRRQQCGLYPLEYDASVEDGIRAHAEYCTVNGYHGHDQVPGKRGYTPEGAAAGRASVLGYGVKSALDGMEGQLSTLYHRSQVLSPSLQASGFVIHGKVFGMNVRQSSGGPLAKHPLVYPPHGMRNVRCRFSEGGESPMPVPSLTKANELGTSVALFLPPLEHAQTLPAVPVLRLFTVDKKGRLKGELRTWLRYPGRPPKTGIGMANGGNVSFTSRGALQANTAYRGYVHAKLPCGDWASKAGDVLVYEWDFRTGR